MPNESFTRGLIQFCQYLEKYDKDYKLFVFQSLSSLLKFVSPTVMQTMYTAVGATGITTDTFHKILFDFFVFFNDDYLSSNCIIKANSVSKISIILDSLIEGKLEIIDVRGTSKVEYKFSNEDIVTLKCIQDNLKNFSELPNTNIHTELQNSNKRTN